MRKANQSPEQIQILIKLREQQPNTKQVNWRIIADQLNKLFPSSCWNPQRCRDKYINCAKYFKGDKVDVCWACEQLELLRVLYQSMGPKWSLISSCMSKRSQNEIKNKFNTRIKNLTNKLNKFQQEILKNKKDINFNVIMSMLQFTNQIINLSESLKYTINWNSKLFSFRSRILKITFRDQENQKNKSKIINEHQYEEIGEIIEQMRNLNTNIRCFGVFKVKNAKNYKLSEKGLSAILQFDDVINQQISQQIYSQPTPSPKKSPPTHPKPQLKSQHHKHDHQSQKQTTMIQKSSQPQPPLSPRPSLSDPILKDIQIQLDDLNKIIQKQWNPIMQNLMEINAQDQNNISLDQYMHS